MLATIKKVDDGMNRRWLLTGVLGVIGGLMVGATARGQDGTPVASPAASPEATFPGYGALGIQECVTRSFSYTANTLMVP